MAMIYRGADKRQKHQLTGARDNRAPASYGAAEEFVQDLKNTHCFPLKLWAVE